MDWDAQVKKFEQIRVDEDDLGLVEHMSHINPGQKKGRQRPRDEDERELLLRYIGGDCDVSRI